MRRSIRFMCGSDLLHRWGLHFYGGQVLTRQEAKQLIQETVEEEISSCDREVTRLLSTKMHSLMIWRTLERHKVSWEDCLGLMEAQVAAFPPTQKRFFQKNIDGKELRWWWHHRSHLPRTMVEVWHCTLPGLSSVYTRLMKAETMVQFTSMVHTAVQELPQLDGVLPVTAKVLMRCFELGRAQPEVALLCCRALALANAEVLSRVQRESLAFAYAMLYAKRGQWDVALSVLNSTREVRPSAKRLLGDYIDRMTQWEKVIRSLEQVEPHIVAEAIAYAPHWLCVLKTYERWKSSEAAHALLSRPDCVAVLGWEISLGLCFETRCHAYSVLRPILSTIPPGHSQKMQIYATAIRHTAETMYAGTMTRRAYRFVQRGQWAEAIGLLSGCRYYDVALPLVRYAPRGSALPSELLTYEEALHSVKLSTIHLDEVSFEKQLAIALHGDWTQLTNIMKDPRLQSLLLARRLHSNRSCQEVKEAEVHCFTFQSQELSRLVCLSADRRVLRYFIQVIPPALHFHHVGSEDISDPEKNIIESRYMKFLSSDTCVLDGEGCGDLCAMIIEHLRVSGNVTGERFLQEIARCLASGRIWLAPANRHYLSFAVLRAAAQFHRMDAAVSSRIARSTPVQHLTGHFAALESSMRGLVLCGEWKRAVSLLERRKRPYPEAFAVLAYGAPRLVALKILRLLWKDNRSSHWVLLIQDLLHGDARRAREEVRSLTALTRVCNGKQKTQWRRRVLGACCAFLQSSQSMHSVLEAANLSSICSLDVDEYGLQRLILVLPWKQALIAISDAIEKGEVVEEHWSLLVCTKPSIPLDAVRGVVAHFPYSLLLHAVLVHQEAVMHGDLCTAVKAIARYQALIISEYGAGEIYLRSLVWFLKNVLRHFDDDAWETTSLWSVVRPVFNKMVEDARFAHLGRLGSENIRMALHREGALAALLIVGFLYQNLSRALQVPVSAALSSRLLKSAALKGGDSQSALYFFKSLKNPSDNERSFLVFALRDADDAMTILLNTGRFVHPRPDQVLLWRDQTLGKERWRESIHLLSQFPPPEERLLQLCKNWTWAECLHALELFRRTHSNPADAEPYITWVRNSEAMKLKPK